MSPRIRTILAELRSRFDVLYGDRLVKLILYGSQARGDAKPDSDIDVLVVLKGPVQVGTEIERGSTVTAALSLEHDVVISSVYVAEDRYNQDRSPLLLNVEADGIAV
jgi:predicted nucleotidyltransferase